MFSYKFAAYFHKPFPKNTSGGLILSIWNIFRLINWLIRWKNNYRKIQSLASRSSKWQKSGGVCIYYKEYFPVIERVDLCNLNECLVINPIQDWGGVKRPTLTSFSPVTSTNVGINSQNFLTFSVLVLHPFAKLV